MPATTYIPQDEGGDIDRVQELARREFRKRSKQFQKQATKKLASKAVKKIATKGIIRFIAIACGATVIGLVITYLIWTVQAISSNLMGSKWIPKLDSFGDGGWFWWEFPLWIFVSLVLLIALLISGAIAILTLPITNPGLAAIVFAGAIFEGFRNFFGF